MTTSSSGSDLISNSGDSYTQPSNSVQEPPKRLLEVLKYLGPSVIITSTIVGSGEVILTASLGAAVGYSMLWWVLLSCWSKSIVQAELTRYIVLSGDTYPRALNRIPGKITIGKGKKVSWPVILVALSFLTSVSGLGGLIGGATLAILLAFPDLNSTLVIAFLGLVTVVLLGTGSYRRLESLMLIMVGSFTILTLVCFILMQGTEYATTLDQLASGFKFEFYPEFAMLALAAYGYTGVNSGEIGAYTYWCIEKGYPAKIGPYQNTHKWLDRAKGWLSVLRIDVWVTLIILTMATVPFYFLGAGILHATGQTPLGQETVRALSGMYTETLGGWSIWVFATGAFFILYSSTVSAVAAQSRILPDYFIEFGFLSRDRIDIRKKITRWWIFSAPVAGFLIAVFVQRPVLLVSITACVFATMLPIQSWMTLYLQNKRLPSDIRPRTTTRYFLVFTLGLQTVMAFLVLYFVVFKLG